MVTAGVYQKSMILNSPDKRSIVLSLLFRYAEQVRWHLQAWAIKGNHYHFVAVSPENAKSLRDLISRLHEYTAKKLNRIDGTPGRKV